jgi:pilus assembly protein Flp/PilA
MEFKKHGQMSELKEGRRGKKRQEGKRIDGAGSRKKGNPWCLGENEPTLPGKKTKNKKNMEEREMEKMRNFFKDESGATMVEYGLLVALIAVACIVAVGNLATGIQTVFTKSGSTLTTHAGTGQ